MVHFTSDRHFGHENIITYCSRPYATTHEMNEDMIRRHNELVAPEDHVYDLGDFAFGHGMDYKQAKDIFFRLHGRFHFVEGNHDKIMREIFRKHPQKFESYDKGYIEIEVEGQQIVLCHYAMREWHHNLRGVWHLFGHTHGQLKGWGKSFDVGVDPQGFKPVSFEQVKAEMDKLEIAPHAQFNKFRT